MTISCVLVVKPQSSAQFFSVEILSFLATSSLLLVKEERSFFSVAVVSPDNGPRRRKINDTLSKC